MKVINPPRDRIFESHEPFKDFFYENNRGWLVPNIEKIKSLALRYDFVLANCSTEHWGSERDFPLVARVHDILAEHFTKNFMCLCHDPSDEALRSNILYFPFFAWNNRWRLPSAAMISNTNRNFLFSNLNHWARDFRIANYVWWQEQPYAHKCLISMHNNMMQDHDYDGHFVLTTSEIQTWQRLRATLPSNVSDGFGKVFATDHPAFRDSYLHLVSESTIKNKIFLTEKTWQTILAGQLFMIWGNPGIVSHLRDLGVDVFDDIVDHGYDSVLDHRVRLDYIHKELHRLAALDWPHIYHTTYERRHTNSESFATHKFISKLVDKLRSRLPEGAL